MKIAIKAKNTFSSLLRTQLTASSFRFKVEMKKATSPFGGINLMVVACAAYRFGFFYLFVAVALFVYYYCMYERAE